MQITVYTKPGCVQCDFTKRELDRLGLVYEAIDVTQDAKAAETLAINGFLTAPVVKVDLSEDAADIWSGFKPEKIRALAQLDPASP